MAWTFESENAPGDGARLPLLVVRFAPALEARGRAPAGAFDLPLYIDPYRQASSTLTDAPSVEASFGDGVTWSKASVQADGLRWKAQLEHPDGTAYVSLRTSAADVYGNAVEQTLIRPYALDSENRALVRAVCGCRCVGAHSAKMGGASRRTLQEATNHPSDVSRTRSNSCSVAIFSVDRAASARAATSRATAQAAWGATLVALGRQAPHAATGLRLGWRGTS